MTHVFLAPHPDDVALSCGGLVAGLRELGQSVTIVTVYSGGEPGALDNSSTADGAAARASSPDGRALTEYQRTALGFGSKALFPNTGALGRDNVPAALPVPSTPAGIPAWAADPGRLALTQELANLQSRQFWQRAAPTRSANVTAAETRARPLADSVPGQGSLEDVDLTSAAIANRRRIEDERYASMLECSVVWLDLPDAVYRGYEGDDQLLGAVHDDDPAPHEMIRLEILRLEPQAVYAPLGVGNHVDHQLCREAALALLDETRGWVMPAPGFVGRLSFYEDFPYAWWNDFHAPSQLPDGGLTLPPGVALEARYVDITERLDRKTAGIELYASQIQRLFESERGMLDALAGYHARLAREGGIGGFAERYWGTVCCRRGRGSRTEPSPSNPRPRLRQSGIGGAGPARMSTHSTRVAVRCGRKERSHSRHLWRAAPTHAGGAGPGDESGRGVPSADAFRSSRPRRAGLKEGASQRAAGRGASTLELAVCQRVRSQATAFRPRMGPCRPACTRHRKVPCPDSKRR